MAQLHSYTTCVLMLQGGKQVVDGFAAGRGRGMQQDRRNQQRKKKVQKGLEDNVRRTVYISYIDQQVRQLLQNTLSLRQDCSGSWVFVVGPSSQLEHGGMCRVLAAAPVQFIVAG